MGERYPECECGNELFPWQELGELCQFCESDRLCQMAEQPRTVWELMSGQLIYQSPGPGVLMKELARLSGAQHEQQYMGQP